MNSSKIKTLHVLAVNLLVALVVWTHYGLGKFSNQSGDGSSISPAFRSYWNHYRDLYMSLPVLGVSIVLSVVVIYLTSRMKPDPRNQIRELARIGGLFLAVNHLNFLLLLYYFKA